MAKQPRILAGETAAITGAARGIGRATADAFLRQGMRVAIGDVDFDAARKTAEELGPRTSRCRSTSPTGRRSRRSSTAPKSSWGRSTCSSTTPGSCRSGASSTRTT